VHNVANRPARLNPGSSYEIAAGRSNFNNNLNGSATVHRDLSPHSASIKHNFVLLCTFTPSATVIEMSGHGMGGKGLGKGGVKRRINVRRDNILGITVCRR